MPTAASAALRAAVHDALIADASLTGLLGGPKVYDEPPRAAAFPTSRWGRRASPISPPAAKPGRNTSSLCTPGRAREANARRT
jgi:hypothetical protein